MDEILFPVPVKSPIRVQTTDGERSAYRMLLICFVTGAVAGAAVGLFSPKSIVPENPDIWLADKASLERLPAALFNAGQYLAFVLLLSTSFLGVLLIPAAAALRAYLLSCFVSAFFAAGSYRGRACAFLVRGVPALFSVPVFLTVACDSLLQSRSLFRLRFASAAAPAPNHSAYHLFFSAAAVLLEAWYECCMLPRLLEVLM